MFKTGKYHSDVAWHTNQSLGIIFNHSGKNVENFSSGQGASSQIIEQKFSASSTNTRNICCASAAAPPDFEQYIESHT